MLRWNSKKAKVVITDVALPILGVAGVLTLAFIAPNTIKLFGQFGEEYRIPRRSFRKALYGMQKRGYIRKKGPKTSWEYELTPEGRKILEKKQIENLELQKPKTWDKKWRLVIFDIPEINKTQRAELRNHLQRLGFKYLNLSVWIHPYECRDEISAIVDYYDVGKYVRYLRVEDFDGSNEMQKRFKL